MAARQIVLPTDTDLAAVAALTTQTYGRDFLTLVDRAAFFTKIGLLASDIPNLDASKISDFTTAAIAAVPTTSILEVQVFS